MPNPFPSPSNPPSALLKPSRPQAGFSLLELLAASLIGFLAVLGILEVYRIQSESFKVQTDKSTTRMNAQFTLEEARREVMHAGMGLPSSHRRLYLEGRDLVVLGNGAKREIRALRRGGAAGGTRFSIAPAEARLLREHGFVLMPTTSGPREVDLLAVDTVTGEIRVGAPPGEFPADTLRVFPIRKVRLALREAGFSVYPLLGRRGGPRDSLVLAEGIDTLSFRFVNQAGDTVAVPPDPEDLMAVKIKVVAKSVIPARQMAPGEEDGYARETLSALVAFRGPL